MKRAKNFIVALSSVLAAEIIVWITDKVIKEQKEQSGNMSS